MYDYNRVLSNEYYQPMVDQLLTKENQGIFHTDNVRHSTDMERWPPLLATPDPVSRQDLSYPPLNEFLVQGYAKQIKERNQATGEPAWPSLAGPGATSRDQSVP